jgi:hypothetical protein
MAGGLVHNNDGLTDAVRAGAAMRRGLALLLLLSALPGVAGCRERFEWHQKLTVEIDTPEGPIHGSAVQAIEYRDNVWFAAVNGPSVLIDLRGEAVVVPMPGQKYIFMLLKRGDLAYQVYTDPADGPASRRVRKMLSIKREPVEVPLKLAPPLIMFSDISDPDSVFRIDPSRPLENLGGGTTLSRITLEITDEPVTEGQVKRILPWLSDPAVVKNPGWSKLSLLARRVISRLVNSEKAAVNDDL